MPRTDCRSLILEDDIAAQHNLGWRLEPGVPDPGNPLLEPAYPWDSGATFSHGTFLRDPVDGLWKGWYISTPMGEKNFESFRRLTYATSEDGIHWTRPALDLCPQPGHPKTNILFDFGSGGISIEPTPPCSSTPTPSRRADLDLFAQYNRAIEAVAAAKDCLFVDLLAGYGNAPWLVHHDGVHANGVGHLVVAHRIFEILARSCSGLARHTRQLERTAPRWRDESTLKSDHGY